MQGVDERLAILEVEVEGALRDTRLRDNRGDAQPGEPVALGDDLAGPQQRLACAAPLGCDRVGAGGVRSGGLPAGSCPRL